MKSLGAGGAPARAAKRLVRKKILLVDDQAGFAALLQRLLPNFEVRAERQSTDALDTARRWRPHLLLLDIDMPELDGLALAAAFSQDPKLCSCPIVFLSGQVTPSETSDDPVLLNGYEAFAKPFDIDVLKRHLERRLWIGRSPRRADLEPRDV